MAKTKKIPVFYDIIIDWFQFTLKGFTVDEASKLVFNCSKDELTHTPGGLNGYTDTFTYGHKCHMFYNFKRLDMGVNVMFSGSACRDYEEVFNFKELLEKINKLDKEKYNFNRIDIAIDCFSNDFTVKTIQRKADAGAMTSRFKTYTVLYEAHVGNDRVGEQIQFGSKGSNLHIVFYNKLKERIAAGYQQSKDIKSWVRCELRFRSDMANSLFDEMVQDFDGIGNYTKGVLRHYLSFKTESNLDKRHRCRGEECRWWRLFTENAKSCKLSSEAISSNIFRKRRYVDMKLSKLISLLYVTDRDLFKSILENGIEKINKHDLDIINAHFILNNQQILRMDDLKQIIRNYNEV